METIRNLLFEDWQQYFEGLRQTVCTQTSTTDYNLLGLLRWLNSQCLNFDI